eukprot:499668-Pelagomonas_calceolata.AAC.1
MSGRVLAQHMRALPGETAWRRLTSPPAQQKDLSAKSKKLHTFNILITPPHIRSAQHTWCMVSTERYSNPLEFDVTYNTYFSTNCRDQ